MDLSPREQPAVPARRRRNWGAIAVLVVALVAGGVVVTRFLTSAIDYYCNVDEIDVKSGCDGDRRIRIQGTVEQGSLATAGGVTSFVIAFNGAELPVIYDGEPGGLFQECIPVVVHGRLTGDAGERVFEGDRVEAKHSEEYEEDNGERVDDAESAACLQQGA